MVLLQSVFISFTFAIHLKRSWEIKRKAQGEKLFYWNNKVMQDYAGWQEQLSKQRAFAGTP